MLRKTNSVYFQFIYVEVRGKTPSGRHNCLFLLSVSQDVSVSSRGPTTAPVFPAHPSFAWLQRNIAEIPLWEASRALVLQRQPEKAWPRAWPTSGTSWKASVDTRNQWKQKEEGRRRSCNGRSRTSEGRQRQVHRWVPVGPLPGQKRRWEEAKCQDLPPGQPASRSRTPCRLHLTPRCRVRGISALGT